MRAISKALAALFGGLAAVASVGPVLAQQMTIKFGYLADPSHEAVLWAVRNGKVTSPKVKLEATPLDISALIQATPAKTFDIVQTAAVAVPRARERGLDLRIMAAGLRYHASGEGAGIWVKKDSPIRSVADLKGKKLGVYSIGSAGITLVRIALADVHGLKVGLKGGDLEFVETPAPALPAALAAGRIDAGTLIHAQAFKAQQTGEFRSIAEVAGDLTKKFNLRMISAVLAGYGEKLDKDPELYLAALDLIKRSSQYAVKNAKEVFAAAGKQTNTDPDFFQTWFTRYSEFPAELIKQDVAAIELLYKKSVELDLMKSYPPMSEMVWSKVAAN